MQNVGMTPFFGYHTVPVCSGLSIYLANIKLKYIGPSVKENLSENQVTLRYKTLNKAS